MCHHHCHACPTSMYTRRGSGIPLVLLHGIGHRREAWDPVIDRLAEHFDVIAPDLSGFGQSPAFAGAVPYTMENACDHIADQFAVWGITKPHVVGNSLGGAISLELGSRGLVSSVTALSPAGFFGHVGRVQALVPLFLLRFSAFITPEAGPALPRQPGLGSPAHRVGPVHAPGAPRRRGDLRRRPRAEARHGVRADGHGGGHLRVRPPGARSHDDRVGHEGPHPASRPVEDGAGAAAPGAARRPARHAGTCRWPTTPT